MAAIAETHRDLLETPGLGVLTTNGPDGYPQASAVGFLFNQDGKVRLSVSDDKQKVKNLSRNPRCSFLIFDPANPYRYLEFRADATVEPDVDYAFAKENSAAHGSNVDVRTLDPPGVTRMVVTLTPVRYNTHG